MSKIGKEEPPKRTHCVGGTVRGRQCVHLIVHACTHIQRVPFFPKSFEELLQVKHLRYKEAQGRRT